MILTDEILSWFDAHRQEAYDLLVELAQIPAPSNHEEKRAEFCRAWLEAQGAKGVLIDEALNVVYPVGCTETNDVTVYMGHSDVVFPDTEPLPLRVEGDRLYCPGVGDDTANAVAVMMTAKYIAEKHLAPADGKGVVLVVNSGEEGLGNLKGSRKIMETYAGRVKEFVTFDSCLLCVINSSVGSHRYHVEIDTEGGHSYNDFGNRNAIIYLASLIDSLCCIKVPTRGKTTYNVGTISGGTSVNTIAQHAEMLYEYRAENREDLAEMERHFMAAVEFCKTKGVRTTVTKVGDRPCMGDVDPGCQQALVDRAVGVLNRFRGPGVTFTSGSTDCNIPLSLGVPAIAMGCAFGMGAHTRDEYVEISSLPGGLKVAADMILHHF